MRTMPFPVPRRSAFSHLLQGGIIAALLIGGSIGSAHASNHTRPYGAGPLTASDFAMTPPATSSASGHSGETFLPKAVMQ